MRPYPSDDAGLVLKAIRNRDPEGAVAIATGYEGDKRRSTVRPPRKRPKTTRGRRS
jgi:hypothetical protein